MHAAHPLRNGITLGELIEWGKGSSSMSAVRRRELVRSLWTDSRKVTKGDVFVAIATEKDDGHRYVSAAFAAGAAAAIVAKRAGVECASGDTRKLIVVNDPLRAVQAAAARYRQELGILIIGVTGSSGKTTTRSFIASVLKRVFTIGETYTNWNNHIGVPLSLLRFSGEEWAGVIEMGANHTGEISALSKVAQPDIAVITNVGYAHLGLFGSLAATTRAKFEIADGLNKKEGFLLLNGDDARIVAYAKKLRGSKIFFGTHPRCDVRPERVDFDPKRGLEFVLDGTVFRLSVPARHFLYSALPAVFLGRRCGIPDTEISRALAEQKPLSLRGTIEKKKGVSFIVDCYNANPSSMRSAVESLSEMADEPHRVAIVGDMLELGSYSKRLHRALGKTLADRAIRDVIAVGEYANDVAAGAIDAGMPKKKISIVPNAEAAVAVARAKAKKDDFVLVKGSRGIHLETVFEKF
jgi:UDP-N-acetylmuramoyl-tripeptide--D-alanyl-D-alanine ligase